MMGAYDDLIPSSKSKAPPPDLEAQGQALAASETPEWERRMIGAARSTVGKPADALQQIVGHLTGRGKEVDAEVQERARAMDALYKASAKESAQRPDIAPSGPIRTPADLALNAGSGILNRLNRLSAAQTGEVAGGAEALALPALGGKTALTRILTGAGMGGGAAGLTEPVTSGGDFGTEKAKQIGKGAATGGVLSGVFEGLSKIPGLFRKAPAVERAPRDSEAPGQVASELGRQRDVAADKSLARTGAGASEAERATTDFDQRMKALREAAFNEGGAVETKGTLDAISALEAKNPDKTVRAALKEVRDTIKNATQSSQAANLPAAGARVTPAQLRAMQGQGDRLTVPMADEVRQSINRMIEQKGDKALSAHTKDVLAQVRDSLVGKTPEAYRSYLNQYAAGAEKLDKYDPARSVIGKVKEGQTPTGSDAEEFLSGVFSGKTRERDFKDLVERTAHDPQASKALKQSFGQWLTEADAKTGLPTTASMAKRWTESRGPAVNSGLITEEHAKGIDAVVDDLRNGADKGKLKKAAATVGGFLAGGLAGHPIVGAHTARELVASNSTAKAREQGADMILSFAVGDDEMARLLAAKPTPQNMSEFSQRIEQMLAVGGGKSAAETTPKRRGGLRSAIGGIQ